MIECPSWCVAEHRPDADADANADAIVHRGATREVAVILEGRGRGGPHSGELLVEVSRLHDETAVWVYLGDGWTGFSLSLESATSLSAAVVSALHAVSSDTSRR